MFTKATLQHRKTPASLSGGMGVGGFLLEGREQHKLVYIFLSIYSSHFIKDPYASIRRWTAVKCYSPQSTAMCTLHSRSSTQQDMLAQPVLEGL